ncbi:MAG TPA: hypothetical protein VM680_04705, partial [Verrucomicrobiae bacterium]|nr:hypothetical protein [Verrucomicrobiae bacterium]
KPEVSASRFQDAQKQPDTELLGLRGEVAVLRAKLHEQTNKTDVTSALPLSDRFTDAGFATPESTVQTICWAASKTNKARYKEAIIWGEEVIKMAREQQREQFDVNNIFFTVTNPGGHIRAIEIVNLQPVSDDHLLATVLTVRGNDLSETRETHRINLINVRGEWKWLVPSAADVGIIPFIPERTASQ